MAVHKAGRKTARVAAAVAAAALIGVAASACGPDEDKGSGKVAEKPAPPADSGALAGVPASVKGGVITVGDPKAKHTVKLYEDPRCPICKKFEETGAQALVKPVADGKVKLEYTIASFLDKNLGGSGSVNAAGALRASVEAGKFPQYHAEVFAAQPEEETDDAFTPAYLLKVADKVKGLRGAAFDKAVNKGTYKKWVDEAMKVFTDDGMEGTPTVVIDGKKSSGNALYDQEAFAKELKAAGIS
ncbi:DsbA family protein [Streptomyces formicae]|uniref:Putative membrane protein n=1 Tax=Streptomyces formicae TaxID=1616117 RepID=A0A291QB78_9ACTN|nr:thioredoxin domain-containing protein [Streptomyces formicae]ATL28724.1 putative membrane protein [Streptomyces formicae]